MGEYGKFELEGTLLPLLILSLLLFAFVVLVNIYILFFTPVFPSFVTAMHFAFHSCFLLPVVRFYSSFSRFLFRPICASRFSAHIR